MNWTSPKDPPRKKAASPSTGVPPPDGASWLPPEVPDYELLKRIGAGSYGEVWLARNLMGTYRAVKLVYQHAFESDRPFEREFDGIKRFEPISQKSDSQLKILHAGRREGYFYYVMELADDANSEPGSPQSEIRSWEEYVPRTLRGEIQRRGRLPIAECVEIGLRLTEALAHLHGHGLVHRDIKPSNIIFVYGAPKLADIGLVADLDGARTLVGTEGYLPPEGPGREPADIFSLGKVLYEISTGRDRHAFPEVPTEWDSASEQEAFADLNEVIAKACAPQAEKRYSSAEAMRDDFLLLRAGKSLQRLNRLERRLARLRKASVAGIALTALISAGYFYQQHQTRAIKRLAAQLQLNNGLRLLDEGDLQGALVWFVQGFCEEERYLSVEEEARHRLRIGTVLQLCPRLLHLIVPEIGEGKVADYGGSASCTPDGRLVLVAGYGSTVLVCSAETGETVRRLEHDANVQRATFSGDGRRLVTCTRDIEAGVVGEAQVWELSTGARLGTSLSHQRGLWIEAALNHDGSRLLTFSGAEAQVWNAGTGEPASPPFFHEKPITTGEFSRDGDRVLTASRDGTAQLWNAATGERIGLPMAHMADVRAMFDPGGERILTRSLEDPQVNIQVWDGFTGRPLFAIAWPYRGDAFFTAAGQRIVLTSWENGFIQMYDAESGAPIGPGIRQEGGCDSAAVSPDGVRIAFCSGNRTYVRDLLTGESIVPSLPHNGYSRVAFSPDGQRLLTAGDQNHPVIRVWDLTGLESTIPEMRHEGAVFQAAFSPDGRRIVTASRDESARLWDAVTANSNGPPLHTNHTSDYSLFAHCDIVSLTHPLTGESVSSFPSSLAVTNVVDPALCNKVGLSLRLWSTNRTVFFAAFAPDSKRVVTTSYDGTARVWNSETGQELIPPLKHQGAIFHAAFSPDARRIITGSVDWTAQVWDAETGWRVGPALRHRGAVLNTSFSPDGSAVLTASYDMSAQLWDAKTGMKLGPPLEHWNPDHGPVFSAQFSPNGSRIVTTSYDGTAQVWDARTGEKLTRPLRHNGFVFYAEFSPNGQLVVTASADGTAQLWDSSSGLKAGPPLQHNAPVHHATFSPDAQYIATASFDNSSRVWDTATSQPLTPLLRHRDKVWHAEFSPDARRVLTSGADNVARLWTLPQIDWPVADLQLLAQTLAGRHIDPTGTLSSIAPEILRQNVRKLPVKVSDR